MREKRSGIKQNTENKGNGLHPPPLTRRSPFPQGKVLGAPAPAHQHDKLKFERYDSHKKKPTPKGGLAGFGN